MSASVFQFSVLSSSLKSRSIAIGSPASNSASTLSFFAILFRTFEFAREQVVHYERGDVGGYLQVQLPVIRPRAQAELVAPLDQTIQQFVHPVLLLIRPRAHRFHHV